MARCGAAQPCQTALADRALTLRPNSQPKLETWERYKNTDVERRRFFSVVQYPKKKTSTKRKFQTAHAFWRFVSYMSGVSLSSILELSHEAGLAYGCLLRPWGSIPDWLPLPGRVATKGTFGVQHKGKVANQHASQCMVDGTLVRAVPWWWVASRISHPAIFES
jgi:hypothetical protein